MNTIHFYVITFLSVAFLGTVGIKVEVEHEHHFPKMGNQLMIEHDWKCYKHLSLDVHHSGSVHNTGR